MINRIIIFLLITYHLPLITLHSYSPGTTGGEFLKLDRGARAAGMGGGFSAIADDATASYWNPAGLAQLERKELQTTHMNYLINVRSEYIAYAHPLNGGVLGCEAFGLYSRDTRRDSSGNTLGRLFDYNYSLTLSYAKNLSEDLAVGAGLKGIFYRFSETRGNGAALDAGFLMKRGDFRFSGTLKNIGPKIRLGGEKSSLPLSASLGGAWNSGAFSAGTDLVFPHKGRIGLNLGGEFNYGITAFRAGYAFRESGNGAGGNTGLHLGLGLRYRDTGLDYSYSPFGDLGQVHRFSFLIGF
ncbi:MAG TPA: PorV/PorQ family protein [bacterium]|nr:PorV/PorQ family protein [bacterium]